MATDSSILAWRIPWTVELGGLQSMGSPPVGRDWVTSLFTFTQWRRKWQPTPVFLPGESQGRQSLVGCCLWGCRVGHDCSDLAAAATTRSLSKMGLLDKLVFNSVLKSFFFWDFTFCFEIHINLCKLLTNWQTLIYFFAFVLSSGVILMFKVHF